MKLKPCPFCGADYAEPMHLIDNNDWGVKCGNCNAFGPHMRGDNINTAIDRWNERNKNDFFEPVVCPGCDKEVGWGTKGFHGSKYEFRCGEYGKKFILPDIAEIRKRV